MHPRLLSEYKKILKGLNIKGSILEVGANPDYKKSLLSLKELDNATEKIGLNLDGPYTFKDFSIVKGNSNSMKMFNDQKFDLVLCNAVSEHDKFFWKTISEINRVLKKGGLVIYGAPGFKRYNLEKLQSAIHLIPIIKKLGRTKYFNFLFATSITHKVHDAPGDYYRFSPACFKEVFLEGYEDKKVWEVMAPPRIIGIGKKI